MEFRLLSTVDVYADGVRVALGDRKCRLLFAQLVAAEGRPVTTERLIDRMWDDDDVPKSARELVHAYASELRRHLRRGRDGPDDLIPKYDGGYRFLGGRDDVDLYRFQDLMHAAQRAAGHDDGEAARLSREALRQWGGTSERVDEPLPGLEGRWVAGFRHTLLERYRAALVIRMEAELALGHHARLVPELGGLAEGWSHDEDVARLLMLACYRAGRQAEALATYARVRHRLREEFGTEPGPVLRSLHQKILRHDSSLAAPVSRGGSGGQGGPGVPPAPGDRPDDQEEPDGHRARDGSAGRHDAEGDDAVDGRRPAEERDREIGMSAARIVAEVARCGGDGVAVQAARGPAVRLVGRVRDQFSGHADAEAALAQVERGPDDVRAVTALAGMVLLHMLRDRSFGQDVGRMVRQARAREERRAPVTVIRAETINNAQVFQEEVRIAGDWNIY